MLIVFFLVIGYFEVLFLELGFGFSKVKYYGLHFEVLRFNF